MNNPAQIAERYQQGRHLSLVDDRFLKWHSRLPGHVVTDIDAYLVLCDRADAWEEHTKGRFDASDFRSIRAYIMDFLRMRVSVSGEGRRENIEAMSSDNSDLPHSDGESLPSAGIKQEKAAKNGLKGHAREDR